ncbi:hypothetical protein F4X88_15430 [Candidatus Poribacteria bacterium]|nr:hypothetical protein [Candidatus Poribacteria bacterium]MXV85400.1 hypothetical protein [Candidatus Poribacteria bacterium]MYA57678.1 hypothetical protein [Candidatus Poribacteria bacterium]
MSIDSLIKHVESLNNNIRVERTGEYLSVKGNTYYVRGKLKLLGFRWNRNKREWYYLAKGMDLN